MRNIMRVDLRTIVEAIGGSAAFDASNVEVLRLVADSRDVRSGDLFFAITGETVDGHRFVMDALDAGAVAAVVEKELDPEARIIVVPDTRIALAEAAKQFFGRPDERIIVVGITGTNGKTTTTYMVEAISKAAGYPFGVIGTLGKSLYEKKIPSIFTTPGPVELFEMISTMVDAGMSGVAMEVSSHGIAQKRCHGINYAVVAFTNLTQDHLDYHGDMDSYFDTKSQIFSEIDAASPSVICIDDPNGKKLVERSNSSRVLTFAIDNVADLTARSIDCRTDSSYFVMETPVGEIEIELGVPGYFNIYNALCASGIAVALGWPLDAVVDGLANFRGVPGRMQIVHGDQPFSIYVDYSHTPDALRHAIEACRQIAEKRVITVFGAGGDRDRGKRPLMGKVAGNLSDIVVLTSDNPRTEDPAAIIDRIEEGVPPNSEKYRLDDRREAIYFALSKAEEGDVVLIAGKGHEDYQIVGSEKKHFDDLEVASEWLSENGFGGAT